MDTRIQYNEYKLLAAIVAGAHNQGYTDVAHEIIHTYTKDTVQNIRKVIGLYVR